MEEPVEKTEPLTMMERISSDSEMVTTVDQNSDKSVAADKASVDDEKGSARTDSLKLNAGLLPFPDNLMSLLDSGVVSDIIQWLPDGDAFCLKPALFAERVLDKYFQGTKFESFTRKLNRWGFKRVAGQKVPPNTIAYYHKDFLRGSPKLLKNMNGGKAKNASARDKMMRAQHKLDEDNDTLMIATSHFQRAKQLEASNEAGLKPSDNRLGGLAGSMDQNRLHFLTSNSLALEQEMQNRKLQQQLLLGNQSLFGNQHFQNHYFNASQSLALQQQRDDVQMALLLQQRGLQAMRDSSSNAAFTQNQWINAQANMPIGSSGLNALQYARIHQDSPFPAGVDLSTAGRLLLSQQASPSGIGNAAMNNNSVNAVLQRIIESRSGSNSQGGLAGNNSPNVSDVAASRLVQQQLLDEQRHVTSGSSNGTSEPVTGAATLDQQLIELYLLQQQQRNNGSNSASNL